MSILRPNEIKGLRAAVSFMNAGPADGVPDREVQSAASAYAKLTAAPPQATWICLSQMEIAMLWHALRNGAEGVLQPSAGTRADEKRAFRVAANRIADAGRLTAPRF